MSRRRPPTAALPAPAATAVAAVAAIVALSISMSRQRRYPHHPQLDGHQHGGVGERDRNGACGLRPQSCPTSNQRASFHFGSWDFLRSSMALLNTFWDAARCRIK